jgi:hypothetical protein
VHQHQRVVVDVDDPGVRRDLLGDLMGVVRGGQAGADVEELRDPGLRGQVADRPGQEPALHPRDVGDAGEQPPGPVGLTRPAWVAGRVLPLNRS